MANPFVGPQPIPEKRRIYGRNREILELRHLLIAERLVLLYSPSGVGKSSVINAGLLPELGGLFDVWKPVRVNGTPPAGSGWTNPFLWSVIHGWAGGPVDRVGLVEFVSGRRGRLSPLLIFDQFEEVLRVEARGRERQVEFFRELGVLLSDPGIWALFVIREDFLAPLLPLAALLPTHLRARYRLELLDLARAEIVLKETAGEENRKFEPEALTKLVHDLSLVKVQQADGSYREEPGGVVEPMQLQVAGWRLWEKTKEKIEAFRVEDVEAGGGVSQALGGYYAVRMEELARRSVDEAMGAMGQEAVLLHPAKEPQANAQQETGRGEVLMMAERREGQLRDWVGRELITRDGLRIPVREGASESSGLSNELISLLEDAHLVRREQRGRDWWWELAHDRLVGPIQKDNEAWWSRRVSLERAAREWDQNGRAEEFLVEGANLEEMRTQLPSGTPDPLLLAFLRTSTAAEAARRRNAETLREGRRMGARLVMVLVGTGPFVLLGLGSLVKSASAAPDVWAFLEFLAGGVAVALLAWGAMSLATQFSDVANCFYYVARKMQLERQMDDGYVRGTSRPRAERAETMDLFEANTLRFVPFWLCVLIGGADCRSAWAGVHGLLWGMRVIGRKMRSTQRLAMIWEPLETRLEDLLIEWSKDKRPAREGILDAIAIMRATTSESEVAVFTAGWKEVAGWIAKGTGLWRAFDNDSSKSDGSLAYSLDLLAGNAALPPPPPRFYVPARIYTAGGVVATVLWGGAICAVAGIIYPFVFLITEKEFPVLIALVIAALAGTFVRMVAARNGLHDRGMARLAGVASSLCAWIACPATILWIWWSRHGDSHGPYNLIYLLLCTAATPVIVYWSILRSSDDQTYCEICDRWCEAKKRALVLNLENTSMEFVTENFQEGNWDFVAHLVAPPSFVNEASHFLDLSSYLCDQCRGFAALTLREVKVFTTDGGNRQEQSNVLLDRLLVEPSVIRRLQKTKWTEGAV